MAAEAILASTLITEDAIGSFNDITLNRRRVSTGCGLLDKALSGGLVYGDEGVNNISGAHGSTAAETITLQLLISHLISNDDFTATFIDASGNFDVQQLYKGIIARLARSSGNNEHEVSHQRAITMLDRVKIMRVFDHHGMLEGMDEMIEDLERSLQAEDEVPRNTIGDSQEAAEDVVDLTSSEESTQKSQREAKERGGMVIIKNVSELLNLTLRNDYKQGHAILTDVVRRLRHAARRHNLCVILLSWNVPNRDDQASVSSIESVKSRPGLGNNMSYLVDTQIMVDTLPKSSKNANEGVNVMEVVYSRGMHTEGNSAFFRVDRNGELSGET